MQRHTRFPHKNNSILKVRGGKHLVSAFQGLNKHLCWKSSEASWTGESPFDWEPHSFFNVPCRQTITTENTPCVFHCYSHIFLTRTRTSRAYFMAAVSTGGARSNVNKDNSVQYAWNSRALRRQTFLVPGEFLGTCCTISEAIVCCCLVLYSGLYCT